MLTLWCHTIGGISLSYRLEYWSIVFPLGMYSAGTWAFADEIGAEFLRGIPQIFLWLAFIAWLATLSAMIWTGASRFGDQAG
jgi:tellurite resistance protein TehA-like permease